ncbi:MAG: 50S ribosomal protein L11 methyltransferase [Ruminococcaceae bacterium]|nr:50S ribosomal protein L11 methyltransferase [Oscillospiraceae bacterium]
MQFRQLDIYTNSEAVQVLTMLVSELGFNGFIIHDAADFEEFLENKEYNWDYVDDSLMGLKEVKTHITCYVQDNEQGAEMLSALNGMLTELKSKDTENFYGSLDVEIDCVREEDWANNWKQYYKPFTVGEKLIVKPSWEEIENNDGRKVLEIDPASSFGTGQHHTTRLVMELIENELSKGDRLLDLGTGSGILSIAGLLLGAKEVTMVDIFENSVNTAVENTEKNGFGKDRVSAYIGDISSDEALREKIGTGYDMITANIVADVIISMSPFFTGFLKQGGKLIISGIITERLPEVYDALKENNIRIDKTNEKEGWNAILCTCGL